MHQPLFTRLALAASQSEVSQPIAMEGYNTVECDCVLFSGAVDVDYQQSDDLENWTSIGVGPTAVTTPYTLVGSLPATAAYVRLKVTESSGSGTAVVAAGICLSSQ